MKVKYVEKGLIFPAFGRAFPEFRLALVRKDLPEPVRDFVEDHERYHLTDPARWWLWREIKANVYAFVRHPWGGTRCVFMSVFSLDRVKFYWRRFREGR